MADRVSAVFMAVWVILGIVGFGLFHLNRRAAFKRRYFKWYLILVGVLFLGFMGAAGFPWPVLVIAALALSLITYMNIRGTQFCSACGRTVVMQAFFSRAEFCSRCGASLRAE